MAWDAYYLTLYVGGRLVEDPMLRYDGGEVVRLKEDPDTISYIELCRIVQRGLAFSSVKDVWYRILNTEVLQGNLRLVWDDATTIDMLNHWVEAKKIEVYVTHHVDVPEVIDDVIYSLEGIPEQENDDEDIDNEGANAAAEEQAKEVFEGVDAALEQLTNTIAEMQKTAPSTAFETAHENDDEDDSDELDSMDTEHEDDEDFEEG